MLIEILRQTSIGGQPARFGDVVDAAESVARYFLATGKAKVAVIDQPPAMVPAPEARKPRTRKPSAKD